MSKLPSETQMRSLISTMKRLTQSVDRCAATIQKFNAAVAPLLPLDEEYERAFEADEPPIAIPMPDGSVSIKMTGQAPFLYVPAEDDDS